MPYYQKMGKIPHKRHTTFRKPDGGLYAEQLVSTEGFSSISSLTYHLQPPTLIKEIGKAYNVAPKVVEHNNMQHRSYQGFKVTPTDDYLESRKPILVNNDLYISLAAPKKSMKDYFFKNSMADEMIFIHKGKGRLRTMFGEISFAYGDHLIVPRGTIYQFDFEDEDNRLFIIESFSPIRIPKKYKSNEGQLNEFSPYCERDLRGPDRLITIDQTGDFLVKIKKDDFIYPYTYAAHPFNVVGWDGYHYPFAFNVKDFEPITGRVHQPPPVHQTFEGHNFVTCAFVPRMYDYHPESIPAPYNHSNVDSDELLYYVDGDFMSRAHVDKGQMTLHPIGIPHGPHPGAVEKSIGAKSTNELALMVDTFKPLKLTEEAKLIEDKKYYKSWLPNS